MGELLFSIGYGGSLIVIGWCTRLFIRKMEKQQEEINDKSTYKKVGM